MNRLLNLSPDKEVKIYRLQFELICDFNEYLKQCLFHMHVCQITGN